MKERKSNSKIIQMTADNYVYSGNEYSKEKMGKKLHHIEDYFFDKFLVEEPFYQDIYYELCKIEDQFRYLKEFLVQLDWIVIKKIVKHDLSSLNISEIIRNIEDYIPEHLSPIELQFCYLIMADYFEEIRYKINIKPEYKRKIGLLIKELQAKFKREINNLPIIIEFSTDPVKTITNEPGANGKWWVYPKNENLVKPEIERETDNGKKIMVNCTPAQFATLIEVLMEKDYLQKRSNAEGTAKLLLKIFEFKKNNPSYESLGKVLFKKDRKINADDYEGLSRITARKYLKVNKD